MTGTEQGRVHVSGAAKPPAVELGVDRLVADPDLIAGSRWGLITNYTGVTSGLDLSWVALPRAGAPVQVLFTPEHGLRGILQAGESDGGGTDALTGLPVVDTYRLEDRDLDAAIAQWNLDALVVDLQDIGVRFYTYVWTMIDCMRSAARLGIPFYVLDRPNPLGGVEVEGPGLAPEFSSFVGRIDVPIRHGFTIGELATYAARLDRSLGHGVPSPLVIQMEGWSRNQHWADTALPWVMPSPNIPTPGTALVYPGNALFEGTNASEGRGTTRPFELVGAPWLGMAYAEALNAAGIPGALFRSAWFQPTFSKWANEPVTGAQLYVTGPGYQPVRTGVHMLHQAMVQSHGAFQWREPHWEDGRFRPAFIDLLWGSGSLKEALNAGDLQGALELCKPPADFMEQRAQFLLYK